MPNFFFNKPTHQSSLLLVGPSVEPVSLAQAKLQVRQDTDITVEDTLLTSMIVAARVWCEQYLKRAFITQTWQLNLDQFPFWRNGTLLGPAIQLIRAPVQSVTSVQYLDESYTLQTFDPDLYTVDVASEPGRIVRNNVQPWPVVGFVPGAVTIELVCGFGDAGSDVPINM